jgi:hypothetical protein
MKPLSFLVLLMTTTQLFAQIDQWEKFNSSLLIEVTRPNGVFTCTGVAVSPKLLITAAHCLDGEIKNVRVFTQDVYDPTQPSIATAGFEIHPGYRPIESQFHHDIARLKLKEPLPSNINIYPIFKGAAIKGKLLRFGFGARGPQNIRTVVTPTLRKINFTDSDLELDDMFSYSGDSGGPIFVQNGDDIQIVAIHSTFSHGPEGQFSFNPLLSVYLPWIFPN